VENAACVGGLQRVEGLPGKMRKILRGERRLRDGGIQCFAVQKLHDHKRPFRIGSKIVNANDAWVLEGGQDFRFRMQAGFRVSQLPGVQSGNP